MDYLDLLQRRYSVKKFDKNQKVSEELLHKILEAGKLSASSLGLQPYKIYVVSSPEMLEQITPAFYNTSQVSTCSHLLALVAKKDIDKRYLDGYFQHITEVRDVALPSLDLFRSNVDAFVENMADFHLVSWAEKQAYITLGNLMFAAALEQVDTCPMEGFNQEILDERLGLDVSKEKSTVTLALGYRAEDDVFQTMKKVRKPDEKLFKFL